MSVRAVASRFLPSKNYKIMAKKIALKIYYDERSGEVNKIDCTKRFAEEGTLFKIDVLKDSIEMLENIYKYERNKLFKDEISDIAKA